MALLGSRLYIADGERHQILRYDLKKHRMTIVAGTGKPGTSGDGGPARRARLTEPVEITFDPAGNLYFSDVNQGRVRRVDRQGIITTLARVPAAAGVSVDPTGNFLAISSIEGSIYRVELPAGPAKVLASGLDAPHDVSYDAAGNLYIGAPGGVLRIDAATGRLEKPFPLDGFKIVPARDGTLYLLAGNPTGGKITHVTASGGVLGVIGGRPLRRHTARTPLDRVGFLPSDVEPVAGAILISETQPTPSIRRLRNGGSFLTTLVR